MPNLHPEQLSWTMLLAKWTEYAQASVALPDDGEPGRVKASVPHVISLQAVTFALGELIDLEPIDRPLARDRADLIITKAVGAVREIWGSEPMPSDLLELIQEARTALNRSIYTGATELLWNGPGVAIMPDFDAEAALEENPDGSLAVMFPGTRIMPGEPVAWFNDRPAPTIDLEKLEHVSCELPRQVYRAIDDDGMITHDIVAPINEDLPGGMPLLVPLVADGARIGHFTMDTDTWLATQANAMPDEFIPVEHR